MGRVLLHAESKVRLNMRSNSLLAIFIFYNQSHGKQARLAFSKEFRHCNVVVYDGDNWIAIDLIASGFTVRKVDVTDSERFLENLKKIPQATAIITTFILYRNDISWKPWLVRSCNELCRYATGIDTGFTFNPRSLYTRLIKYNSRRNFEILTHWRRSDGEPLLR